MSTGDNIVSLMNETRTVADYRTTWKALDLVDDKLGNLAGTIAVFDAIDLSEDEAIGRIACMQRHVLSDLEELRSASVAARAAILKQKPTKGGAR